MVSAGRERTGGPLAPRVALVCRERTGDENLGVRYLAGSLKRAGIEPSIVPLNHVSDIGLVAERVIALGVPLVGVSLSDSHVALDLLSFVEWVRRRGYLGHIVAGGALATVERHQLLDRYRGLDSIVRLEGEETLGALAQRVISGQPWDPLPGLTSRAGDGPPLVHQRADFSCRPLRMPVLPTVLGIPSARVVASRGCPGQCAYCGSAALRRTATEEAERAGWSPERVQHSGIAGRRLRPLADFADEVAELYHERGVRCFHLPDDNVLGSDECSALDWLAQLGEELGRRAVGRLAWSIMLETGVISEAVADKLADFGLVSTLLGVESLTAPGLVALGRRPEPGAAAAAVARLHRRGVAVFFNSILLHPASTGRSLAEELSELPLIPEVPFDALPLLVYPGTELHGRLLREGALLGGMFGSDYRLKDGVASRFRALLHQFWAELPAWVPLASDAHNLATLSSMARRLGLPAYSAEHRHQVSLTTAELNALRVAGLKRLLAMAETEADSGSRRAALTRFIADLRPSVELLQNKLGALRRRIEQPGTPVQGSRRFFVKTGYAASLLVLNAACGGAVDGVVPGRASHSGGAGASNTMTVTTGGSTGDESTAVDGSGATGGGVGFGGVGGSSACSVNELDRDLSRMDAASTTCDGRQKPRSSYVVHVDSAGRITGLEPDECSANIGGDELRDCILTTLAGETFPCISDGYVWGTVCVLLAR